MNRRPFRVHEGTLAPLPIDNVDTDQIIPSREMKTVGRTGLAEGLFAGWRYLPGTDRTPDPRFVLNSPACKEATVLVSGENFGCGSSREHAVWALAEYGIRTIIAASFGDIFYNNCIRNGVLPIRLPPSDIARLMHLPEGTGLTIDLPEQTVQAGSDLFHFDISVYGKRLLVEGLDPIGLTLKDKDLIARFQVADRKSRPWVYERTS